MHKQSGLMPGISSTRLRAPGFSFIELIVAITIIGIMATFVVPRLFRRTVPASTTFINELNTLVQHGALDAMAKNRLHRILFDFEKDSVLLQMAKKQNTNPQDMSAEFVSAGSEYITSRLEWPDVLEMKHFFIGKTDEIPGAKTKKVWFYIGSDGTVQDVTLVILDDELDQSISLITNPFTAQLTVYDGVRKP